MDSTLIGEWAIKIAREVTPNEVYQAQFIANEYVRGGRDRKRLFKQIKGSEVGGSGLGEMTLFFPYVLEALAVSGPIIYKILSDGAITNGINLIKETKEAYEIIKKKRVKKLEQGQAAPTSTPSPIIPSTTTSTSLQQQVTDQSANSTAKTAQIEQLHILINEGRLKMANAMAVPGVSIEEREDKSQQTMLLLFETPEDAARFIKALREKKS